MDTNIYLIGLLASLLVLQAVGIYLLLIRKRFKVTNGKVDLEDFLHKLDEDVASGHEGLKNNIKQFNKNIDEHNKVSKLVLSTLKDQTKELVDSIEEDSKNTKKVVDNTIDEFKNELNELVKYIHQDSSNNKEEIGNIVNDLKTALNTLLSGMHKDIESMKEEVGALRSITLEKEEKIKRYEEGYDQNKIKNFRQELFRILHFIEDKKYEDDKEALIEVHEDLGFLLEDVGIEKVEIEIEKEYNGSEKMAAVKGVELTADETKEGKIAKIVRNGFYIQIAEGSKKVLRPAEIILYQYANSSESEEKENNVEVEGVNEEHQLEDTENKTEGK